MNHEVEVSNLMFNKTSEEQTDFKKYDINIELEEKISSDQKTVLKYSLDLTSNPKNSVINISGNAILNGEQEEIEEMLKQDEQNVPQIVSLIYQELFSLMYIISKNMKIPSPAHTLSQNNVTENKDSTISSENKENLDEKIESQEIESDEKNEEVTSSEDKTNKIEPGEIKEQNNDLDNP